MPRPRAAGLQPTHEPGIPGVPGLLPQCLVKRYSGAGTATYSLGRKRLFSRQLFYRMPPIDEWADQFEQGDEDMDSLFSDWGDSGKCSWTTYMRGSMSYNSISPTRKRSDSTAASHAYSGTPVFPTVIRCEAPWPVSPSISAGSLPWWPSCDRWRVSSPHKPFSILSFQSSIVPVSRLPPRSRRRTYGDGIVPSLELRIDDDDFQAVLSLVEPLYRHSAGILSLLPSDEVPRSRTPTPQEALFAALPLSFNRQQALEEAERNNIPTATLDTCLKRMQERGTLEKNGRGEYSFGDRVTHK